MKLQKGFYLGENVLTIAKELIGKILYTNIDKKIVAGIITETEAYNGIIDRASHAYNGRRTNRNEIMYSDGGTGYVYKCYGIHDLFNVVTNQKGIPHAILIRAVYPVEGIKTILKRRNMNAITKITSGGPGTVSQAFGIKLQHNGIDLSGNIIWIEDQNLKFPDKTILVSKRIGVEGAGDAAHYPFRFYIDWKACEENFNHLKK